MLQKHRQLGLIKKVFMRGNVYFNAMDTEKNEESQYTKDLTRATMDEI